MRPKSNRQFDLVLFLLWLFLLAPPCDGQTVASTADPDAFPNARRLRPHCTDISCQAGVDHAGKSVSAIWLDPNDIGGLDLVSALAITSPMCCIQIRRMAVMKMSRPTSGWWIFAGVTPPIGSIFDSDGNCEWCFENQLGNPIFRKSDGDCF